MKQYADEEIIDVSCGRSLLLEKASNGARRYIDTAGGMSLTVLSSSTVVSTSIDDDIAKDVAKDIAKETINNQPVPNVDVERNANVDAETTNSPSSLSSMYRSMRGLPISQVKEAIEFLNGNSVLVGLSRLMVFDEDKYEIRVYSTFQKTNAHEYNQRNNQGHNHGYNHGRRLIRTIAGTEQVDTFIMGIYDLYSC